MTPPPLGDGARSIGSASAVKVLRSGHQSSNPSPKKENGVGPPESSLSRRTGTGRCGNNAEAFPLCLKHHALSQDFVSSPIGTFPRPSLFAAPTQNPPLIGRRVLSCEKWGRGRRGGRWPAPALWCPRPTRRPRMANSEGEQRRTWRHSSERDRPAAAGDQQAFPADQLGDGIQLGPRRFPPEQVFDPDVAQHPDRDVTGNDQRRRSLSGAPSTGPRCNARRTGAPPAADPAHVPPKDVQKLR